MDDLFAAGDDYLSDLEKARASEKRKAEERLRKGDNRAERKPPKGSKPRDTDPWK